MWDRRRAGPVWTGVLGGHVGVMIREGDIEPTRRGEWDREVIESGRSELGGWWAECPGRSRGYGGKVGAWIEPESLVHQPPLVLCSPAHTHILWFA